MTAGSDTEQLLPLRVGIIGLRPPRSWAFRTHLPALRGLPDFEIAGVANSSRESGEAAAAQCGIARAFASVSELVASDDIDVVAVTVKVPHHFALVAAALAAGKHVYCEWPLGNGVAEAAKLADMAREHEGQVCVAGMQAIFALPVRRVRTLLDQNYFGSVLSMTLVGTGVQWGPEIGSSNEYILDRTNGATMLTIPLGHSLAAIIDIFGPVAEVYAQMPQRRRHARNIETGAIVEMTSADQILATVTFASGVPLAIHYRGGTAHGTGAIWDVNGDLGDIRISAPGGHLQLMPLDLAAGSGTDTQLRPIRIDDPLLRPGETSAIGNVRRCYSAMARAIRTGERCVPTFDQALAVHEVLAAFEKSAGSGLPVRIR